MVGLSIHAAPLAELCKVSLRIVLLVLVHVRSVVRLVIVRMVVRVGLGLAMALLVHLLLGLTSRRAMLLACSRSWIGSVVATLLGGLAKTALLLLVLVLLQRMVR
jgi:hypothetical protein